MPIITNNKKTKGINHDIDSFMEKRNGLVTHKNNTDEDSNDNGEELNEDVDDLSDEDCKKHKAVGKLYPCSHETQQSHSTSDSPPLIMLLDQQHLLFHCYWRR